MKKLISLILVIVMLLSLAACGDGNTGSTKKWPEKQITLICGYSAGGSSDLQCRILAEGLKEELGVPVVVENKTGNGGYTGFEEVLNAKPDGYTFGLLNTPGIAVCDIDPENPKEYNAFSFDLLANHVSDFNVVAWKKDETRWTDMESFVAYAKENELLYGCSVMLPTGDDITVANYLCKNFDTKLTAIPSGGAKDNETFLMNGSADFIIGNCADVLTGIENNTLTVGMVCAPERVSLLPDVPTCSELGLGDFEMFSARLYAFPNGVDAEIKEKMIAALEKVIKDEKTISQLDAMGTATNFHGGDDCVNYLKSVRQLMIDTNGLVEKKL